MKHFLLSAILWAGCGLSPLLGQTAEDLIAQGRVFLRAHNVTNANERFAAAVALAPGDPTANVFRALGRVLTLPYQPQVAALLDRMGMSPTNRNLYHWTAGLPNDTNGIPLAPGDLSAQELINVIHERVVPELANAESNLAQIKAANFTLMLTGAEAGGADVTLDLGDVQVLRFGLQFARYLLLTVHSWNFDAQLTAVRELATGTNSSAESLLSRFPALFSFTTPDDLGNARAALQLALARYEEGSPLVRERADSTTKLFNLESGSLDSEDIFHRHLKLLVESLDQPRSLPHKPAVIMNLDRQFMPGFAPREFLPQFMGNAFVLGTFPDLSFGGVVQGVSRSRTEEFLTGSSFSRFLGLQAAAGVYPPQAGPQKVSLKFDVQPGRVYDLEGSDDLHRWLPVQNFVAQQSSVEFTLPGGDGARFFRLTEPPAPPNDHSTNAISLTGNELEFREDFRGAFFEPYFPGSQTGTHTLWWQWTATTDDWVRLENRSESKVSLAAYSPDTFGGLNLETRNQPENPVSFRASRGVTYYIAATARDDNEQVRLLLLARPPPPNDVRAQATVLAGEAVSATGYLLGATADPSDPLPNYKPSVWWRWTAPVSGRFRVNAVGNGGFWTMGVYGPGPRPIGFGGGREVAWDAMAGTTYNIRIDDNFQDLPEINLRLERVTPPINDDIAQAATLAGRHLRYFGTNSGAIAGAGEPVPSDFPYSGSVWFRWVAPENGFVDLSVGDGPSGSYYDLKVYERDSSTGLLGIPFLPYISTSHIPLTFEATMGQEYFIRLATIAGESGPYELSLDFHPLAENDDFARRISLAGDHVRVDGSNRFTTSEAGDPLNTRLTCW
ncbi:MAG TPA: hypothetical protein VMB21_17625, partial [Candidatus Limnocylindria bacterium]|nr:hypothetical protein [Candidatus Limnocylindria bacterium]